MTLDERINAFERLGKVLNANDKIPEEFFTDALSTALQNFENCIQNEYIHHSWFIPEFIRKAVEGIRGMLEGAKLRRWLAAYPALMQKTTSKRVGVIIAGNIPMVGFHDFLCVLMAGDVFIGKLSSNDKHLLPLLAEVLCVLEPRFKNYILFTEGKLEQIDEIIATGSNNSARYFDYYFAKYPSIIRKHCNSVAILDGTESETELAALVDDICLYFGLGCRSISKVYVPENYDFTPLFVLLDAYKPLFSMHNAFLNNLEYQKTVHLINRIPFLDQGIMMFKEHHSIASAIGIVHYEYYKDIEDVWQSLALQSEVIQCIESRQARGEVGLCFGQSQFPEVWDYANKIDTLTFLIENSKESI